MILLIPILAATLTTQPTKIFTYAEQQVLISANLTDYKDVLPTHVTIVQYDKDNKTVKYRWDVKDDGLNGDIKANDGIFSQIAYFKSRNAEDILLHIDAAENTNLDQISATIQVVPRPTFAQIMAQLWDSALNAIRNKKSE